MAILLLTVSSTRAPMDVFTSFTLILIAGFAAVVVIALLWGARLKRLRKQGHAEFERDEEAARQRQEAEAATHPKAATASAGSAAQGDQAQLAEPELPTPAATTKPEAAPPTTPTADTDLTQLKGLGPRVAAAMADQGVTSIAQLAALSTDQTRELDAKLGSFSGRMSRDRWIEQARLLNDGDRSGYEAAFGKLG